MKIVFIYADNPQEFNTSNWRCVIPSQGLVRNGHESAYFHVNEFAQNNEEVEKWCASADVIVVERNLFGDVLVRMQYWKVRNKIVVCNFDDSYDKMTPDNPAYRFWFLNKGDAIDDKGAKQELTYVPPPMIQFKWGLRVSAAAMLPSKKLMEDWKDYVDCFYMPNYLDLEKYRVEKPDHKGIIIGWGGSLSHYKSFVDSHVLRALKKICKNYPEVRVMIAGDKRVFDKVDIPESQKIYQNFVIFDKWANVLSNFDIGIAPLAGEYDKRRSLIKPLEYMIMKIPWIGSNNVAYDSIKKYGQVIKNDYYEWYHAIDDVIKNLQSYREQTELSYQFAVSQSIDNNIDNIIDSYKQVIRKGYRD